MRSVFIRTTFPVSSSPTDRVMRIVGRYYKPGDDRVGRYFHLSKIGVHAWAYEGSVVHYSAKDRRIVVSTAITPERVSATERELADLLEDTFKIRARNVKADMKGEPVKFGPFRVHVTVER